MKQQTFVLELERGDTATGLFFEGSCLVPAPDKAIKFDNSLVACNACEHGDDTARQDWRALHCVRSRNGQRNIMEADMRGLQEGK